MTLSNKALVSSWVIGLLVLVVGAFVLSAMGLLDRPPKATPPQLVQVECYQKSNRYDGYQRSGFLYFWSDGTITVKENEFNCPDSMYVETIKPSGY